LPFVHSSKNYIGLSHWQSSKLQITLKELKWNSCWSNYFRIWRDFMEIWRKLAIFPEWETPSQHGTPPASEQKRANKTKQTIKREKTVHSFAFQEQPFNRSKVIFFCIREQFFRYFRVDLSNVHLLKIVQKHVVHNEAIISLLKTLISKVQF